MVSRVFFLCAFCSHLTSEMTKCKGELVSKESELQRLRRDVAAKVSQISRMDESLQHMKSQLDSKSDMGTSHSFCYLIFAEKIQLKPEVHKHCTESALNFHSLRAPSVAFLTVFLPSCSSQWRIWRRRSIAVRPTSSTVSSGSRSWWGSCRRCGESWLTHWSNYKNSEMFCKEPKPSQMSGKPRWKNWLSNLGEDTPLMWNILLHTGTGLRWRQRPRAVARIRSSAVSDSSVYPHCTCVSQTHQQTRTHTVIIVPVSHLKCHTCVTVCLLDNVANFVLRWNGDIVYVFTEEILCSSKM